LLISEPTGTIVSLAHAGQLRRERTSNSDSQSAQ
jgi:hypothetical protein